MLVEIPKVKNLDIRYLVFDYNGTVALNGILIEDFVQRAQRLESVTTYVITADTYGTVRSELEGTGVQVEIISKESGSEDKLSFIRKLGAENVVAFGNGSNDRLMLEAAAVGICILGGEGASVKALTSADLVVKSLDDALKLIEQPMRLVAGLRE